MKKYKSFKDLEVKKERYTHLGTYTPGKNPYVRIKSKKVKFYIPDIVTLVYNKAIDYHRKKIADAFTPLFGERHPIVAPNRLWDMRKKLDTLCLDTKRHNTKDLMNDFNTYLGRKILFFRVEEGKEVFIEPSRIVKAHQALLEKKGRDVVETILFR